MNWKALINRLKEPSTYAAFAAAATLLFKVTPTEYDAAVAGLVGVFVLAAALLSEKGGSK